MVALEERLKTYGKHEGGYNDGPIREVYNILLQLIPESSKSPGPREALQIMLASDGVECIVGHLSMGESVPEIVWVKGDPPNKKQDGKDGQLLQRLFVLYMVFCKNSEACPELVPLRDALRGFFVNFLDISKIINEENKQWSKWIIWGWDFKSTPEIVAIRIGERVEGIYLGIVMARRLPQDTKRHCFGC